MTREEAIEAIKCNRPDSRYTILREALDMAISALRQQERFGDVNKSLTLDELRAVRSGNQDEEPDGYRAHQDHVLLLLPGRTGLHTSGLRRMT